VSDRRGGPAAVVETHDRDVTRDAEAGLGDGLQAADGHEVVRDKQAVWRPALPEQVPGGCIAALGPEVAVGNERGIKRAPGVAQGRPVPRQPTGAGRGLDRSGGEPDPAAALGDQVPRRLARGSLVVGHDAVDRYCCQPPVNGHHWDAALEPAGTWLAGPAGIDPVIVPLPANLYFVTGPAVSDPLNPEGLAQIPDADPSHGTNLLAYHQDHS
jgi:hypothetical protein